MPRCNVCKESKPIDAFTVRANGKPRARCKACRSATESTRQRKQTAARAAVGLRSAEHYSALLPWATDHERAALQALLDAELDVAAAAEALGTTAAVLRLTVDRVERYAARRGGLPGRADVTPALVPAGFRLGKQTLHVNAAGEVVQGWHRVNPTESDRIAALLEAVAEQTAPLKGLVDPAPAPGDVDDELMAVVPIGDAHIGMLSWALETGGDWDLETAERVLVGGFATLLARIPRVARLAVVDLGDWFHADNQKNETPRGGHRLDVDSRLPKLYAAGIRIERRIIDAALAAAPQVYHRACGGNHDPTLAITKRETMAALYEREPRLTVDRSPREMVAVEWGSSLVAFTHGHGKMFGPRAAPGLLASWYAEAWGRTRHRQIYTGHRHHDFRVESPGCVWSTERILAPADAHAHHEGYDSGRSLRAEIWHRRHGRVGEHVVHIDEISPDADVPRQALDLGQEQ